MPQPDEPAAEREAQIAAVSQILIEELAEVTPSMLEAGSRAAESTSVEVAGGGKRRPRMTSEAELLTAIWRAMLAAKLTRATFHREGKSECT